jgi:hypothetical protein
MDVTTGNTSMQYLYTPGEWYIDGGLNSVIKDNKIIYYRHESNSSNEFDIYDIAANSWSIGVLPFIIKEASIISVNNTIYIAGGIVNGVYSDKVWKLTF